MIKYKKKVPDSISEPEDRVPRKDANLIRKVHRILKSGKDVEIRLDTGGDLKVIRVSRENV